MRQLTTDQLKKENVHNEYKKAKGGLPSSFWESYSAFANSDGGDIFLGIGEPKKYKYDVIGLDEKEIYDLKSNIFSLANNKQKVSVNILTDDDIEEINIDNKNVLVIHVKRCPRELRPVYINSNVYGGSYRRNADGDYHCTIDEINSMIRDSSNKIQDIKILEEYDISSLNKESIKEYKQLFANLHPAHPFIRESDEKFLEFIGATRIGKNGKYHPTISGLLMFGYSYRILYEFPEYFLDYQYISEGNDRWLDRINSDSGEWSGNVFDFFFKTVNKLTENIDKPFKSSGVMRIDENDMILSIREALCNTLCNTDYYLKGGTIIKKYDNRIIFKNPGSLMMDINRMIAGGDSEPRNKNMLKLFNLIGIGERSGSGIPFIFITAKKYKYKTPVIDESHNPDSTTLIVYINNNISKYINNDSSLAKEIISFLKENGQSSAKMIATYLNKNITTIKLELYKLVDSGTLSTSGTIKDKVYFLK